MENNTQNRKQLFWNRKMITEFIQLYKESVCLYDMSHENYDNSTVTTDALKNIAQEMRQYLPNIELEDVQNKIDVVRTQLSEEISLAEEAKALGKKYVPKLWCYDQLEFLHKHIASSTKINDTIENNPLCENTDDAQNDDSEISLYTEMKNLKAQSTEKYSWRREDLKTFICLFKKYNILYDRKHKDYLKRPSRDIAYSKLLEETKQIDPQISLEDVRLKIHSIRSQYVKELRRIKKAQRNNEMITPNLWSFKLLANLYNDDPEIIRIYNLNNEETDLIDKNIQESDVSLFTELEKSKPTLKYKWKREVKKTFITLFKKYSILYDQKHKDYLKPNLRFAAFNNLLEETKQIDPQISLKDVRSNIHTIRSQYCMELRRIKKAQRNNKVYIPKLWCFKMLANLYNDEPEIKSFYNLNDEEMESIEKISLCANNDGANSDKLDALLYTKLEKSTLTYNWEREALKTFIKLFKKYSVLYDSNHKDYSKKTSRFAAYNKLLEETKKIDPLISLTDVRTKIHSLRSQYAREMKYVERAQRHNEEYTPRLWCFDMLANLYNGEPETNSYINLNDEEMTDENSLTTMHLSNVTTDQENPLNIEEFKSEEIPLVMNENEIEHEEALATMNIEKNCESILSTMGYECVSTIEYGSNNLPPVKKLCYYKKGTDNNGTDLLETNIESLINNREVKDYEWLGDLVESQLKEILPRYYAEFAWEVQRLIRNYILKTKADKSQTSI